MSALRLTFEPEDEWHGELHAVVESDGFAGAGSAWFGTDQLREFCERLGDYPLNPASLPLLQGGYWDDRAKSLKQVHLSIRIGHHNQLGALSVSVTLAEPKQGDDPPGRERDARTWYVVGYNDLSRFKSAFERVLAGKADVAILEPGPT